MSDDGERLSPSQEAAGSYGHEILSNNDPSPVTVEIDESEAANPNFDRPSGSRRTTSTSTSGAAGIRHSDDALPTTSTSVDIGEASTASSYIVTRSNEIPPPFEAENNVPAIVEEAEVSISAAVVPASTSGERRTNENIVSVDVDLTTPSPPKKRKRLSIGTPQTKNTPKLSGKGGDCGENDDDVDDGCTCPVCFDQWEMSGEHRLVALRCGHLFGESCIRRWLAECSRQSGVKMCPQCKAKAAPKDIRFLYAKRVRAIDRTEEHELRKDLEHDRKKLKNVEMELDTLKITYAITLKRVQEQDLELERLKASLRARPNNFSAFDDDIDHIKAPLRVYKLFMEKNIELSRDAGCRVMAYAKKHSSLLVSQKSSNGLFPGFGVRVIDVPSFRAMQFTHLTSQMLRDISISADQQIMACTSMEPSVKLYDFRMRTTSTISAPNSDKKLWACALGDAERGNYLYTGGQQGRTYVFDIRYSSTVLAEYETLGDFSPVIKIVIIPKSEDFPSGAFCICKLQSIWFYEHQAEEVIPTRLNVDGPFMSMNYEESQSLLIITARTTPQEPDSRYLIGKLRKIQMRPHFELKATLLGSKSTPVMTRSCHISINSNSLLASYIQDSKQLALFDIRRKLRIQSLPVVDVIFDTCPIYTSQDAYVAALTENKCRIYKLNEY